MDDIFEPLTLMPVGVVHSPVLERRDMPTQGVQAQIEVFPPYRDGLLLIDGNTHLWIVGWYSGAERDQLQIVRPEYVSGQRRRGVFGLRSTTRPNSLGLCASELVSVENGWLTLDHLDFLDGTPVLDIRRYSPSWDAVFSARSSRERMITADEATRLDILELDGMRFHGASSAGVVAAARLMQHVIQQWQVLPRDESLTITVPASGEPGEQIDALQGITAATFGSGRLSTHSGSTIRVAHNNSVITAQPHDIDHLTPDEVRDAGLEALFAISERAS